MPTDEGTDTAMVPFPALSATDNADGTVDVICTPPLTSAFKVGKTDVSCSATDKAGNTKTCPVSVTIKGKTLSK